MHDWARKKSVFLCSEALEPATSTFPKKFIVTCASYAMVVFLGKFNFSIIKGTFFKPKMFLEK
jgi:hypothetical protein